MSTIDAYGKQRTTGAAGDTRLGELMNSLTEIERSEESARR
jgi:hypothetical protein